MRRPYSISVVPEEAIFRIGKVVPADGRLVCVKVDKAKNTSDLLYKGQLVKNVSAGGSIKIAKGFTSIVGKVDGEFVEEDKYPGQRNLC